MIDTLRVLVSWECNMRCAYCCNHDLRIRAQFRQAALDEIAWPDYRVVCITGGEPLLTPRLIPAVCERVQEGSLIVLYTNGVLLDGELARKLDAWGVRAVNVGLHGGGALDVGVFDGLIRQVLWSVLGLRLKVRFHAHESYRALELRYPGVEFRFWKMDDCDRENEDRVVLNS